RAKEKAKAVGCMSNQRQIQLRHRMALDEEAGTVADNRAAGDWYFREFGRKEFAWMCPSAPVREFKRKRGSWMGSIPPLQGEVDAAWGVMATPSNFTSPLYSNWPENRVPRAGGFG